MLVDAFCDLVLGGRCAGCERPGRALCASCRTMITGATPQRHQPTPCPVGFPPTMTTGRYEGCWPPLLAAYKEHGVWGLAPTLAECLWPAVLALMGDQPVAPAPAYPRDPAPDPDLGPAPAVDPSRLVLVPMPSRPAAVRNRGLDTTAALVRQVSRRAVRDGQRLPVRCALRLTRRVADSTGLDAVARRANLTGALELPAGIAAALRRDGRGVVLVDDLVTTGASLTEATRAITAAGVPVVGAVTLAATPRQFAVGAG